MARDLAFFVENCGCLTFSSGEITKDESSGPTSTPSPVDSRQTDERFEVPRLKACSENGCGDVFFGSDDHREDECNYLYREEVIEYYRRERIIWPVSRKQKRRTSFGCFDFLKFIRNCF